MAMDAQQGKGKTQEETTTTCPPAGNTPGGRPCPPPAMMCEYLNDYMCWWHQWALEVHKKLWPNGNTTDPEPPPWPPFK